MISRDQVPDEYRVPKGGFGPVYHATERTVRLQSPQIERGTVFGPPETVEAHPLKAPVMHVGTRKAAHDRLRDRQVDEGSFDAVMYEATIRTGASVGPLVADQTANWVNRSDDRYEPDMSDLQSHTREDLAAYDVLPYTNAAEDRGSVSYAVKPQALRNVRPSKKALNEKTHPTILGNESEASPELVRPGTKTRRASTWNDESM